MMRPLLSLTKFAISLALMAMVCSLAWDGLVNGRLYDRTGGGSFDFWIVGHWVHHPVTVAHIVTGRALGEPDIIKTGWRITGLSCLWFSSVAFSFIVSFVAATVSWGPSRRDTAMVLARLILGSLFLYMGLSKAIRPEEFLKLVREYHLVHDYLLLNLIALGLPWFEAFCGLLLVAGVAVRGAALNVVLLLIPFTTVVLWRALADPAFHGHAFRTIKFDCGCGNGAVFICDKLIENSLLVLSSAALVFGCSRRLCLWHSVVKSEGTQKRGDEARAL
jgi:uncharacterized membrane protein YphA (DoxX/SURF4 family)